MPLLITSEGAAVLAEQRNYERYQSEVKRLEKRIKSYSNRRRKPENLAMDQRRLEEMKTSTRDSRSTQKNVALRKNVTEAAEDGDVGTGEIGYTCRD